MNSRAASTVKYINNKYGKSGKVNSIIHNYRIWIKKYNGYSNEDLTELLTDNIFKNVNSTLMRIKNLNDIKFIN
jgi:hypothetical protein